MSSATKNNDSKEYSIVEFHFKKWIGVLFKDGLSDPIDVQITDLSDVYEEDGEIYVTVENKRGVIVAQSGMYLLFIRSVSLKLIHFIQVTTHIKCIRFNETDVIYLPK